MIIDSKNEILIFGNRKCASKSIRKRYEPLATHVLRSVGNPATGFEGVEINGEFLRFSEEEKKFFARYVKHYSGNQLRVFFQMLNLDYEKFLKVVVIRNPYRRVQSSFAYAVRSHPDPEGASALASAGVSSFVLNASDLVSDALDVFTGVRDTRYAESRIFVARLETLEQDLRRAFAERPAYLNLLSEPLDVIDPTDESDGALQSKFSPLAKSKIEDIFAEDFRVGGYEKAP